jgi:alanine racemase
MCSDAAGRRRFMSYSCWAEIDLDALRGNIDAIRAYIGIRRKFLLTVKADAYGHGAVEVARATSCKVHGFGVATLHEGLELRHAGIRNPVLILSPSLPSETDVILEHDLIPTVSNTVFAEQLSRRAVTLGKRALCHVEVDTGMGRAGVDFEGAAETVAAIARLPGIALEGVYTHFPVADIDPDYTAGQVRRFQSLIRSLRSAGLRIPITHAANSAGIFGPRGSLLQMVRPGLLAYGMYPGGKQRTEVEVRPAMCLKARVVHLRDMEPGGSVSYGRSWVADAPTRVASVSIGYGHGYPYHLSRVGDVLIHGERAPIVGAVTMDLTMVDVTRIPQVRLGDEVVLFGRQGNAELPVHEMAAKARSITYEIICGIGRRVVRVYYASGEPVRVSTLTGAETMTGEVSYR